MTNHQHIDPSVLARINSAVMCGYEQAESGIYEAMPRCLFCNKILSLSRNKNQEYCDNRCKQKAKNIRRKRGIK